MKKEVYEAVLTFNISINRDGLVAFVMPTQDKHSSHIRSSGLINPLAYKLINNQQLPNTLTRQLTNSRTHKLIISPTHLLTNSSPCKLTTSPPRHLINSKT